MTKKLSKFTRTRLVWRNGKKVRAHRWLMEQILGRKLEKNEHVHHKNRNPLDNRIDNLQVLSQNTHIRIHNQKYPDIKHCAFCGEEFRVNPRKRKRNKTCSLKCAMQMRVSGIKKAAVARRRVRRLSPW